MLDWKNMPGEPIIIKMSPKKRKRFLKNWYGGRQFKVFVGAIRCAYSKVRSTEAKGD